MFDSNIPLIRDDEHNLVAHVERWMGEKNPLVISLDGVDGTGKSTLSKAVVKRLSGLRIELDAYLPGQKSGRYVESLDFTRLQSDYQNALVLAPLILIEGICLREVCARAGIATDHSVYVLVRGEVGGYRDRQYYAPDHEIAHALKEWSVIRKGKGPNLAMEILSYHRAYRPFETVDLIYENVEGGYNPYVFIE